MPEAALTRLTLLFSAQTYINSPKKHQL
ncbi:hypothetical protein VCHENC02_5314A, partial [Vibrio harveyi]